MNDEQHALIAQAERTAALNLLGRIMQEAAPHGVPRNRRRHLAEALLDHPAIAVHVEPVAEFPDDGSCPCGDPVWEVHESGYHRTTSAVFEPAGGDGDPCNVWALTAYGNGWSDMSETGDHQWVECATCFRRYLCPDEIDWQS